MSTLASTLSSLKAIIDEDFCCPICLEPCSDMLINPECGHRFCGKCVKQSIYKCNHECPTCRVHIPNHRSCCADLHFDHILHRLVTDIVSPLESFLNEKKTSDENKRQKMEETHSAVEVGGAETKEVDQALDEVCAQNHVIAVNGSRKRHRSSQEQQFLSAATATNDEAMYTSGNGNGNDAATVERGRKTLKMNEHDCSSQQVRSSRKRRERPAESYERTETKTAKNINNSSKKTPERHDPSEASNETVIGVERGTNALKTNENDLAELQSQHAPPNQIVARTDNSVRDSCSSYQLISSSRRRKRPAASSCEITEIEAAINSSGKKIPRRHDDPSEELLTGISHTKNPEIIELPKDTSSEFQKRIKELRAFKAKFGHCKVTKSQSAWNKPYLSLGKWCSAIRRRRRLMGKQGTQKLCKAEIECLVSVGFPWSFDTVFDDRIKELRAFKAKFGHCNVTKSQSASNKPYLSLAQWCDNVRQSRRLTEEGRPGTRKLCKDRMKSLEALGFQWKVLSTFDDRIKELRAFKAKFGHCNVTKSRSASNKPYLSLGKWCSNVRYSRSLMGERKTTHRRFKLCKDRIKSLDDLGFYWKVRGKEGMLSHTSNVNASGLFNVGSSTGKSGIAIILDSMKRFAADENLQAMSCWSMVNISLIPSQKVALVRLGGISTAVNAMIHHPLNAEVQFRALFAVINLVIPSANISNYPEEAQRIDGQVAGMNHDSEIDMLNESFEQVTNLVVVAMKNFCSSEAILNRACLVLYTLSLKGIYHRVLLLTPNCYQMLEWCIGNYRHDKVLQSIANGTLQRLQITLNGDHFLREEFRNTIRAEKLQQQLPRENHNAPEEHSVNPSVN